MRSSEERMRFGIASMIFIFPFFIRSFKTILSPHLSDSFIERIPSPRTRQPRDSMAGAKPTINREKI